MYIIRYIIRSNICFDISFMLTGLSYLKTVGTKTKTNTIEIENFFQIRFVKQSCFVSFDGHFGPLKLFISRYKKIRVELFSAQNNISKFHQNR